MGPIAVRCPVGPLADMADVGVAAFSTTLLRQVATFHVELHQLPLLGGIATARLAGEQLCRVDLPFVCGESLLRVKLTVASVALYPLLTGQ